MNFTKKEYVLKDTYQQNKNQKPSIHKQNDREHGHVTATYD